MEEIDIEVFLKQLKTVKTDLEETGCKSASIVVNKAILIIRQLIIDQNIH